jgi:general stress protein YciG
MTPSDHDRLGSDAGSAAASTWMSSTQNDANGKTETAAPDGAVTVAPPRKKQRRGFAAMSAEKQRLIASLGGKAAHAKGTAHEFSPEEAREAGRKGGQAAQRVRSDQNAGKH